MIAINNLIKTEKELKKRWLYSYVWGRKQTDGYDRLTNFIYRTRHFEDLINQINKRFCWREDYSDLLNYAMNRWYGFWSAMAVEGIFCSFDFVERAKNPKDKMVDFTIDGICFDHKTTVYPKRFPMSIVRAVEDPKPLVQWLYKNQSTQKRTHYGNKLFVVVFSPDGQHWKLKAELLWLRGLIFDYLVGFDRSNLIAVGKNTYSDVIWAIGNASRETESSISQEY